MAISDSLADRQRLRDYLPHCGWPALYYGIVPELGRSIGAKTIIEIGVAYGYHAADILRTLPDIRYYGIDPYRAGYDTADPFAHDVATLFGEASEQTALDRLYVAVRDEFAASFGDRAHLARELSLAAAKNFPAEKADIIFIDGDHRYEQVKEDLAAWWPILREGGIYCGDDYLWPDVKRAIDEFAAAVGHELRLVGKAGANYPIWLLRK